MPVHRNIQNHSREAGNLSGFFFRRLKKFTKKVQLKYIKEAINIPTKWTHEKDRNKRESRLSYMRIFMNSLIKIKAPVDWLESLWKK